MLECLLNVIFFDGAFIKNIVFRHMILGTAALDINHNLIIIALAIVPSKRTQHCE